MSAAAPSSASASISSASSSPPSSSWGSFVVIGKRTVFWLVGLLAVLLVAGGSIKRLLPVPANWITNVPHNLEGQSLDVWVDSLRSTYSWDPLLMQPFGEHSCSTVTKALSLDEALSGSRLVKLPITVDFNVNVSYAKLCEIQVTPAQQMMLYRLIEDKYCLSRLVVAGHVVTASKQVSDLNECPNGIPVGRIANNSQLIINNHLAFFTYLTSDAEGKKAVAGVEAVPMSYDFDAHEDHTESCRPLIFDFARTSYRLSYSFHFVPAPQPVDYSVWQLRSDSSSLVRWIVPFLTTVALTIITYHVPNSVLFPLFSLPQKTQTPPPAMIRQMRDDMTVTPVMSRLLMAAVSSGVHLTIVFFALIEFFCIGLAEQPHWPVVVQTFIVLYMTTSFVVGFTHARVDRQFHGKAEFLPWYAAKAAHDADGGSSSAGAFTTRETVSIHIFAVVLFVVLLVCNIVRYLSSAFSYIPLLSFLELAVTWAIFGLPLAFVGKYLGHQSRPLYTFWDRRVFWACGVGAAVLLYLGMIVYFVLVALPVVLLNMTIARNIVPCKERRVVVTPWHVSSMGPLSSFMDKLQIGMWSLLLGAIPFIGIVFELESLLDALLGRLIYLSVQRLWFVFCTFVLNSILVAWMATALSVHHKDYSSLSWRAFLTSATTAVYIFVFSIIFCLVEGPLTMTLTNVVLFLAFAVVISLGVLVVAGSLGFFASQVFIHRLFSSYGTIVSGDIGGGIGEERFLTLNGVRFNPELN